MNLQHNFLIAMPSLQTPQFRRSVIYICEHNNEGAMGLVINKPMEQFTVETILNRLKIDSALGDSSVRLDSKVLMGGPLAEDRGFILHSPQNSFAASIHISPDTMLTTSKDVLETLGTQKQPKNLLVVFGYAGWQSGQLEQELLDNVWLTTEADVDILFNTPIAERWQAAANKLGINIFNIASQAGHA